MALTLAHDAALSAPAVTIFCALEIVLPTGPLRLLDGAGTVTFGGRTFTGRDPVFGALATLEIDGDGMDGEAPELTAVIHPPSNTAAAILANPAQQGAVVSLWMGVLDPVSGLVVPDPDLLFVGEVDVPELSVGEDTRALSIRCVSIFERFFEVQEGVRLNDAFHQSIWPGERGFEYAVDLERQLPWGQDAPAPGVVRAGSASSVALTAAQQFFGG